MAYTCALNLHKKRFLPPRWTENTLHMTDPTTNELEQAKQVMKMHGAVRQIIYNELGITASSVRQSVHDAIAARVDKIVDEKLTSFLNSDAWVKKANEQLDARLRDISATLGARLTINCEKLTKQFEEELKKEFSGLAAKFIKDNIAFTARVVPSANRPIIQT